MFIRKFLTEVRSFGGNLVLDWVYVTLRLVILILQRHSVVDYSRFRATRFTSDTHGRASSVASLLLTFPKPGPVWQDILIPRLF